MTETTFYIVPHTHWDREWYSPFQVFRARLVDLVDDLVPMLENDPSFTHFMLDGQMAAVDDYLEIRPEMESRLRKLAESGRLQIGPWQILMDEFLVSGENTIRNLKKGSRQADRIGGKMPVGYLPDMFGHISQMPQILAKAGLPDAVVWRGVPKAVDKTVFRWKSPDGSSVRTAYLATSYSNAAQLPEDPDALESRTDFLEEELEPFSPGGNVLLMNGTDHITPQPRLPQAIAELNARGKKSYRISTIPEYLDNVPNDGLVEWTGELRSGSRANLLMGVVSNRVDIRRMAAATENLLERYAEPLAALYSQAAPPRMLELAWDRLIDNAAHDSICACSIDEVVDQVEVRFNEAYRLAEAVTDRAMKALTERSVNERGADVHGSGELDLARGVIAFNPSPFPRCEMVRLEVGVPSQWGDVAIEGPQGERLPTQLISKAETVLIDTKMQGKQLLAMAPMLGNRQVMEYWINGVDYEETAEGLTVVVNVDRFPRGHLDTEMELARFEAAVNSRLDETIHILAKRPGRREIVAQLPEIPALGWGAFTPVEGAGEPIDDPVTTEGDGAGARIENAALVAVFGPDGTVDLTEKRSGLTIKGAGRLVDGGEFGDTYNYSPPKKQDELVDHPDEVTIEVLSTGPLATSVRVVRTYAWPIGNTPGGDRRSEKTVETEVVDTYELRSGEPFLRVETEFENRCKDHRLRVHFPLPFTPTGSDAGTPFDVTHRGLEAEGGDHEFGLPTFPGRGMIDVSGNDGGLSVLVGSVIEYEVIENELALTLLRATGLLSNREMTLRPMPAGPDLPAPAAQVQGKHRWQYALYPHASDWSSAGSLFQAERFVYPLRTKGSAPLVSAATYEAMKIAGEGVQLSALFRDEGRLIARFWGGPHGGRVEIGHHCQEVSILGEPLDGARTGSEFTLSAYEILTLEVD